MRLFRGSLYKKYPGMYRRTITNDERKRLIDLGLSQHVLASSVSLLRSIEVEDIIEGNDDKYVLHYSYKISKVNAPEGHLNDLYNMCISRAKMS